MIRSRWPIVKISGRITKPLAGLLAKSATELDIVVNHRSNLLHANGGSCRLSYLHERFGIRRPIGIKEERDAPHGRGYLLEGSQPFPGQGEFEIEESGYVAAWSRHVGD